jgi:hypothetical protein
VLEPLAWQATGLQLGGVKLIEAEEARDACLIGQRQHGRSGQFFVDQQQVVRLVATLGDSLHQFTICTGSRSAYSTSSWISSWLAAACIARTGAQPEGFVWCPGEMNVTENAHAWLCNIIATTRTSGAWITCMPGPLFNPPAYYRTAQDFCSASGLNTSELAERQGGRALDFFQDEAGFHIFNALLLQQFIHHKA